MAKSQIETNTTDGTVLNLQQTSVMREAKQIIDQATVTQEAVIYKALRLGKTYAKYLMMAAEPFEEALKVLEPKSLDTYVQPLKDCLKQSREAGYDVFGATNREATDVIEWFYSTMSEHLEGLTRPTPKAENKMRWVSSVGFPAFDTTKPAEAQGIFHKFEVKRVDGSDQPGGKHHGCDYFVLDLQHDAHAKAAMLAYGAACYKTHPKLSADILAKYS